MFKLHKIHNNLTNHTSKIVTSDRLNYINLKNPFTNYTIQIVDLGFTGKTFKWGLRSRFWKLIFNRAHKTLLHFKSKPFFKKFSKTKVRVFMKSIEEKNKLTNLMLRVRKYNIFTQRGLKIKGFICLKKRGKISTYR